MAEFSVDTSELAGLAQDLRLGYREAADDARAVMARAAFNVKRDWQKAWSGLAHAPHVARAVTYDVTVTRTRIVAEVGPDKSRRQGALGNLLEYGSVHNAPIPGGAPALRAEEPRLVAAVAAIADPLR